MKRNFALTLAALVCLPALAESLSLQTAPPVVVRTSPTAGATEVTSSTAEIRVTYSKPMQDGSWSWSTWGEENYPETTGSPRYLPDGRTCVLPVKLKPDKFYALWLNSDNFHNFKDREGRPAVPYLLTFCTGAAGGQRLAEEEGRMTAQTINQAVTEFPAATDLSTPQAACAAWQRALAAQDAKALSQLSWSPLDPEQEAAWFKREEARDAKGLALYLKAVAESKILTVQIWRGTLANVVSELAFPPGQGRHPFSARVFGRINGQWKNLGEDRLPTLAAARANFEQKKEALWIQLAELTPREKTSARSDRTLSTNLNTAAAPSMLSFAKHAERLQTAMTELNDLLLRYTELHPSVQAKEKQIEAIRAQIAAASTNRTAADKLLNANQRAVLDWTDRQFHSFFDARTFDGWSEPDRAALEKRSLDALKGPETREYYQAINTLAALGSTNALPALRDIAFSRLDKNNRDRWMAVRALGLMGDKPAVPELLHLVYHGNQNTHWWAQISLVRLTGQNFGSDWKAWGEWWNRQGGQPPYKPEIVRWWNGQPEEDKLAESLAENDRKFLESLK